MGGRNVKLSGKVTDVDGIAVVLVDVHSDSFHQRVCRPFVFLDLKNVSQQFKNLSAKILERQGEKEVETAVLHQMSPLLRRVDGAAAAQILKQELHVLIELRNRQIVVIPALEYAGKRLLCGVVMANLECLYHGIEIQGAVRAGDCNVGCNLKCGGFPGTVVKVIVFVKVLSGLIKIADIQGAEMAGEHNGRQAWDAVQFLVQALTELQKRAVRQSVVVKNKESGIGGRCADDDWQRQRRRKEILRYSRKINGVVKRLEVFFGVLREIRELRHIVSHGEQSQMKTAVGIFAYLLVRRLIQKGVEEGVPTRYIGSFNVCNDF